MPIVSKHNDSISVQTSIFFSLLADSNQFKHKAAEESIEIAPKYVAESVDISLCSPKLCYYDDGALDRHSK